MKVLRLFTKIHLMPLTLKRSHFVLDRNELLIMARWKHCNTSKYITKPTTRKQGKAARPKPLAVPQKLKPKAKRLLHLSPHYSVREISL